MLLSPVSSYFLSILPRNLLSCIMNSLENFYTKKIFTKSAAFSVNFSKKNCKKYIFLDPEGITARPNTEKLVPLKITMFNHT